MLHRKYPYILTVLFLFSLTAVADTKLRFDFEAGLDQWRVVDGAFGALRTGRATFHHGNEPYNKEGNYFLSTLETPEGNPDDGYTGYVESAVFILEEPKIYLMVGGGNHPNTYVSLCTLDGAEVCWARGDNAQEMKRHRWDVPELVGKPLFIRVCDQNTGSWGHVTVDDIRVKGTIDKAASETHWKQAKTLREQREARKHLADALLAVNPATVKQSFDDLKLRYPEAYAVMDVADSQLAAFSDRVDALHGLLSNPAATVTPEILEEAAQLLDEKRDLLLRNPLLTQYPILFVVRQQYKPDHHNTATLFQTDEVNTNSFTPGGALKVLDLKTGGTVTTLIATEEGVVRDPEVSFDGKRVLFSMRQNINDNYHIYEMAADGSKQRQLTGAPGVADIDPVYLPEGDIIFSSTREPKYCMCNQHIMANLFRMHGDGANIHQIGKSTLFEGHAALMPDGRILYDRWEYVDRNFGDAQGLWTVNPDGTNHAVYYGNNTWSPGGVIDARPVPGTDQVICVFGSCHDRPWGALALLDTRLAVDGREAVLQTWPSSAIDLVSAGEDREGYGFDNFIPVKPKYEDPYPLDEKYFLCSRMTGNGEEMGIYLVDVFGNETLVHVEAPGCFDPMPLAPRDAAPAVVAKRNYEDKSGSFYVADVYEGTHMQGVARGAVKFLRVVESPEKRFFANPAWGGQGVHRPAINWHSFETKRILGTVPVEADGSAYFEAPADTFVYFQLLDENGMMVQSMRSGVMVQPGEQLGCVGCHEHRLTAPPAFSEKVPLAIRRRPHPLDGWYGEPRLFSFMAETQPVFTKHCAGCHDYGEKAGEKLVLAPDRSETFNAAYNELWRKKYIAAIGAGPSETQPAYSWGSHKSKIVEKICKHHHDVNLSDEEFARVVTWIDINATYYPDYACAYPDNLAGRCPLDNKELHRLGKLTGIDFFKLASFNANQGPQISFDRPELSSCLKNIKDTESREYKEALALIQEGTKRLTERPRGDMPGFVACEFDQGREAKYVMREDAEETNRQAILEGKRIYDPQVVASE